ncbi:hypothetical protein CHS0354_020204 [Potamilus streckersoni]|uniref:Protein phosphatase 1 regulatory subunit 14C n=1 Tax=Potamilus streckersoni TaxID=2493646 RepID=A0AAE0SKJ9_9BIVA|nr:hypothetical protein CHS0354_020204 [Potamilus streckersoni]
MESSNIIETSTAGTGYPASVEAYRSSSQMTSKHSHSQSSSGEISPRNVSFSGHKREEEKEKRQKYLTARYGQHQMMLIRKRLAVEDWLYVTLRELYKCEDDDEDHDCKLDLEDILNLDTDSERKQYALECLAEAPQPQAVIDKFIDELFQKAKTL